MSITLYHTKIAELVATEREKERLREVAAGNRFEYLVKSLRSGEYRTEEAVRVALEYELRSLREGTK